MGRPVLLRTDHKDVEQQTNQTTAQDLRKSFRSSLEDSIAVIRKLSPHCTSVDDLVGVLNLALENDGQLTLLMREVFPVQLRNY